MKKLQEYSHKYKMPKNRIIEKALYNYFEELKREEYVRSFKRAKNDPEMLELAEQGLGDFLEMIDRES
jgi:ribosomal protein L10